MFNTSKTMDHIGEFLPFALFAIFVVSSAVIAHFFRHRKFSAMTVVTEGVEYPNNHHVFGVGYYHATDRRWNLHPWNEFREGQGFYWDGVWRERPDQRQVAASIPDPAEIVRVNEAWRKADPDKMKAFWSTVDRFGFGTAVNRSEGS
jgi:hypothetical protein